MCLLPVFAACGCSNGSVSEECDQVTGACQCLEGAIGDKCDGCGPDYEGGHDSWTCEMYLLHMRQQGCSVSGGCY